MIIFIYALPENHVIWGLYFWIPMNSVSKSLNEFQRMHARLNSFVLILTAALIHFIVIMLVTLVTDNWWSSTWSLSVCPTSLKSLPIKGSAWQEVEYTELQSFHLSSFVFTLCCVRLSFVVLLPCFCRRDLFNPGECRYLLGRWSRNNSIGKCLWRHHSDLSPTRLSPTSLSPITLSPTE